MAAEFGTRYTRSTSGFRRWTRVCSSNVVLLQLMMPMVKRSRQLGSADFNQWVSDRMPQDPRVVLTHFYRAHSGRCSGCLNVKDEIGSACKF